MSTWMIFDIVAVALLLIFFIINMRKGLLKCIYKIISLVVTVVLVFVFMEPIEAFINKTQIGAGIDEAVYELLIKEDEYNEETGRIEMSDESEALGLLPVYIENSVSEFKEGAIAPAVSNVVKKSVAGIIIFIIAKLVLYLIFMLVDGLFKLPGLKTVNRILGGAVGILYGVVIIYLICGVISLDVSHSVELREIIDKTVVVKYFYDYNVIMSMFLS